MRIRPTVRRQIAWSFIFSAVSSPLVASDSVPGWKSYPEGHSVTVKIDDRAVVDGRPSLHLILGPENADRISFFQSIKADQYVGRTITIQMSVRNAQLNGQVSLAAVTYDGAPYLYFFSQPIKRAADPQEWQQVDLTFVIPPRTVLVSFGLVFKRAQGDIWFAKTQFSVADRCTHPCKSGIKSGHLTHEQQATEESDLKMSADHPVI